MRSEAGEAATVLTDVLDLDQVTRVRTFGTCALNRMWDQFGAGDSPWSCRSTAAGSSRADERARQLPGRVHPRGLTGTRASQNPDPGAVIVQVIVPIRPCFGRSGPGNCWAARRVETAAS